MADNKNYRDTVNAAIDDLAEHGFDSEARLSMWEERIRRAAEEAFGPSARMEELLRDILRSTYDRIIKNGKVAKFHPGIARYTLERVRPALRAELDRRIMASAQLIRLNRKKRIAETLQRFSGWATSIPAGGSDNVDAREERERIRKPIASAPYEERRVLVDQGHKLISSVNSIVATGGGAIAAIWRSHWRQPGYNYRPDHKDRDMVVYGIRGAWAFEKGLAKKPPGGWTDEITQPAEEVFCRCFYVYVYTLGNLAKVAPEALTAQGRAALASAREGATV